MRRPEVPGFWPSNGVVWTRLIDISVAGEQGAIQIGASTQPKPVQSDRDGNRERERERGSPRDGFITKGGCNERMRRRRRMGMKGGQA